MDIYVDARFSFYRGGITNLKPSNDLNVLGVYNYLISGAALSLTNKIRNTPVKRERAVLKRRLDYITPCGTFYFRSSHALKSVSGLMVLDFDDCVNPQDVAAKLPFIPLLSYISPSGAGLKVIIDGREWIQQQGFNRFNEDLTEDFRDARYLFEVVKAYKLGFQQMAKYVSNIAPLDWSGADITRACYLCYASDAQINNQSAE